MAEDLHLNVPSTTYETGRDGRITRGSLKSFMMSTACNLRAPGDTRLPAGCYSTRGVFCESESDTIRGLCDLNTVTAPVFHPLAKGECKNDYIPYLALDVGTQIKIQMKYARSSFARCSSGYESDKALCHLRNAFLLFVFTPSNTQLVKGETFLGSFAFMLPCELNTFERMMNEYNQSNRQYSSVPSCDILRAHYTAYYYPDNRDVYDQVIGNIGGAVTRAENVRGNIVRLIKPSLLNAVTHDIASHVPRVLYLTSPRPVINTIAPPTAPSSTAPYPPPAPSVATRIYEAVMGQPQPHITPEPQAPIPSIPETVAPTSEIPAAPTVATRIYQAIMGQPTPPEPETIPPIPQTIVPQEPSLLSRVTNIFTVEPSPEPVVVPIPDTTRQQQQQGKPSFQSQIADIFSAEPIYTPPKPYNPNDSLSKASISVYNIIDEGYDALDKKAKIGRNQLKTALTVYRGASDGVLYAPFYEMEKPEEPDPKLVEKIIKSFGENWFEDDDSVRVLKQLLEYSNANEFMGEWGIDLETMLNAPVEDPNAVIDPQIDALLKENYDNLDKQAREGRDQLRFVFTLYKKPNDQNLEQYVADSVKEMKEPVINPGPEILSNINRILINREEFYIRHSVQRLRYFIDRGEKESKGKWAGPWRAGFIGIHNRLIELSRKEKGQAAAAAAKKQKISVVESENLTPAQEHAQERSRVLTDKKKSFPFLEIPELTFAVEWAKKQHKQQVGQNLISQDVVRFMNTMTDNMEYSNLSAINKMVEVGKRTGLLVYSEPLGHFYALGITGPDNTDEYPIITILEPYNQVQDKKVEQYLRDNFPPPAEIEVLALGWQTTAGPCGVYAAKALVDWILNLNHKDMRPNEQKLNEAYKYIAAEALKRPDIYTVEEIEQMSLIPQ
jgi:hypothetical protein